MKRKIVHQSLNMKAAKAYVPYQDLENKAMLVGLLEQPSFFVDHIRRYTNSLTTQIIFGFRTNSIHDPKLKQLFKLFYEFSQILSGESAAVLDLYPVLRYLPDFMLPLRQRAKALRVKEFALFMGHWLKVKKDIKEGKAQVRHLAPFMKLITDFASAMLLHGSCSRPRSRKTLR
jgi:hypothetical protein